MNMSEILASLVKLITPEDEVIVLHSSLMHLKVDQEVKWKLLYALKVLVARGLTIAIPSFTFSFTKTGLFDPVNDSSEVGILADWFRELYGVVRTLHPIYSFCVAGPLVHEILKLSTDNCFSENSIFGLFHQKKTRIILLGCDDKYVTQFHYYEQRECVPYRYEKKFIGKILTKGRLEPISTTMYVRDLDINPINDFSEIAQQLEQKNRINRVKLYSGEILSFRESEAAEIAKQLLSRDEWSFVKNKPSAIYLHNCKAEREVNKPIKIAIIGSKNLSLLEESLANLLPLHFKYNRAEIFCPQYGQSELEILNENSRLESFNPDYIFFVDTLADIYKVNLLEDINSTHLIELNHYLNLIELCTKRFHARIFVNNFIQTGKLLNSNYDYSDDLGVTVLIQQSNKLLSQFVKDKPNLTIINLAEIVAILQQNAVDSRLWYIGKYRYSQEFFDKLSIKFIGCILASTGATARAIAVDLDNTLWGGVLGEEGLEGLALGGDYPGNAYKQFQRILLKLSKRGIALVIVSKNDEEYALNTLDKHPEMLIRSDSLAAHYINWREKSENLVDLAKKLNISLENILFVDDNPIEREKVRANLPSVKVIDLPNDPAKYSDVLLSSPYLECLHVTQEDKQRSDFFIKQNQINLNKNSFTNINDFLKSQEIKIYINALNKNNFSRAVQLLNKTNQFNTTTKRYSEQELQAICQNGHEVFVVGISDNSSEYENIGLMIVSNSDDHSLTIESFLLSCRVLGKGIESAMLAWICQYAKQRTVRQIVGEIILTSRNSPVRELYQQHEFYVKQQNKITTMWIYNLENKVIQTPSWLQLIDHTIGEEYAS